MKVILDKSNIKQIGNILWKIRDAKGIPQGVVSERMGKGQSQVSGMERNRKTPGLLTLAAYLEQLPGCQLCIVIDESALPG